MGPTGLTFQVLSVQGHWQEVSSVPRYRSHGRQPQRKAVCTLALPSDEERSLLPSQRAGVVASVPTQRTAGPPPEPVPVQHSPSYLLRHRQSRDDEQGALASTSSQDQEPFSGNAVEWALRRIDRSLDEAEANPPLPAKVMWDVARGPVGAAAAKGATVAARTTVKVGGEALKAAAPVGKWALEQGFRAAVGLVTYSIQSAQKKDKGAKGNEKDKKGKQTR
eukprot:jgi/Botrbrau1/21306/Bobra.0184s0017.1